MVIEQQNAERARCGRAPHVRWRPEEIDDLALPLYFYKVIDESQEAREGGGMDVPLFCFGSAADARRIFVGKRCVERLPFEERYGLGKNSLMQFLEDMQQVSVIDMLEKPFVRCSVGTVDDRTDPKSLTPLFTNGATDFLIRVRPQMTRGLCVYDAGPHDEALMQALAGITTAGDMITPEDQARIAQLRDQSLCWLDNYTGGYLRPQVLVSRQLTFDELELVSGPWPERACWLLIKQTSRQTSDLFLRLTDAQRTLFEQSTDEHRDVFRSALCRFVTHVSAWERPLAADVRQLFGYRPGCKTFERTVERIALGFQQARDLNLPTT